MLRFLFGGLATVAGLVALFVAAFGDPTIVLHRADTVLAAFAARFTPAQHAPDVAAPATVALAAAPAPAPAAPQPTAEQTPPVSQPQSEHPPSPPAAALPPVPPPARLAATPPPPAPAPPAPAAAGDGTAAMQAQRQALQQQLQQLQSEMAQASQSVASLHAQAAQEQHDLEALQQQRNAEAAKAKRDAEQARAAAAAAKPAAAVTAQQTPLAPPPQPSAPNAARADAGKAATANAERDRLVRADAERERQLRAAQRDEAGFQAVIDRLRHPPPGAVAGSGMAQADNAARDNDPDAALNRPRRIGPRIRLGMARAALIAGRLEDARQLLEEAQLQLVFRPVTPAGDDSGRAGRVAGDVASALSYLGAGNSTGALDYVDRAMADARPVRNPPSLQGYGYGGPYSGAIGAGPDR